ncbi:MAG TPA: hypothetical protein VGG39_08390 [Polyangiaceae bacterium]|jgi:hypothetical protein
MNAGTIRWGLAVLFSLAMGCAGNQPPAGSPAGAPGTASSPAGSPAGGGDPATVPAGSQGGAAAGGAAGAVSGGSAGTPNAASPASGGSSAGSSAASGAAAGASPVPKERPFANTPLEAQSIIQGVIDGQLKVLWKCVTDYRTRKNDPHRTFVVDVGIDQEGNLLGITSPNPKKQPLEPETRDCMMAALHGQPFPRSHAGVITVRQTFNDVSVQQ